MSVARVAVRVSTVRSRTIEGTVSAVVVRTNRVRERPVRRTNTAATPVPISAHMNVSWANPPTGMALCRIAIGSSAAFATAAMIVVATAAVAPLATPARSTVTPLSFVVKLSSAGTVLVETVAVGRVVVVFMSGPSGWDDLLFYPRTIRSKSTRPDEDCSGEVARSISGPVRCVARRGVVGGIVVRCRWWQVRSPWRTRCRLHHLGRFVRGGRRGWRGRGGNCRGAR